MKHNVGKVDRIARFVIGAALLIWGVMAQSWLADIIGVVLMATAALRFCGLYTVFGMRTCPLEQHAAEKKERKDA